MQIVSHSNLLNYKFNPIIRFQTIKSYVYRKNDSTKKETIGLLFCFKQVEILLCSKRVCNTKTKEVNFSVVCIVIEFGSSFISNTCI